VFFIDVEHEKAVAPVFEVVAHARHGDIKKSLGRGVGSLDAGCNKTRQGQKKER
jgi:hypothetical protein